MMIPPCYPKNTSSQIELFWSYVQQTLPTGSGYIKNNRHEKAATKVASPTIRVTYPPNHSVKKEEANENDPRGLDFAGVHGIPEGSSTIEKFP